MLKALMWAMTLATLTAACFADSQPLGIAPTRVRSLTIADAAGARYAAHAVPRRPRLALALGAPSEDALLRVALLSGPPDPELIADLFDPPLRETTAARQVSLAGELRDGELLLSPRTPLLPGQRYTLLFRESLDHTFSRSLVVSSSPSAGAALVASWPANGETQVPLNMDHVLLRWDGWLGPLRANSVSLRHRDRRVPVQLRVEPCARLGFPNGTCATLAPRELLQADAEYEVHIAEIADATGARLPSEVLTFRTASTIDRERGAPFLFACAAGETQVGALCCSATDDSLTVRVRTTETLVAQLRHSAGIAAALTSHGAGEITLFELRAGTAYPLALALVDLAGNTWTTSFELATLPPLAKIAIDEVLADPRGDERSQDLIELLNLGPQPMSITGLSIAEAGSARGVMITSAPVLAPGERVIVVGPEFDLMSEEGRALGPATRLARTDAALALANRDLALELRDGEGRLLSRALIPEALAEGQCAARLGKPRNRLDAAFAADPSGGCSLGEPTAWP